MVVAAVFSEESVSSALEELVFGILIVQDVAAVALIAALTAVASGSGVSGEKIAVVVVSLLAVLLAMVVVGMLVVPRLVRWITASANPEVVVVSICGLCFGLAVVGEHLGYSVALGSFLAGMLVAESGRVRRVEALVQPIRHVFAAVFFVSVGMLVEPAVAWQNAPLALALSALVIWGQFLSVGFAALLSGNGLRRSVRAGLSLGQVGEFSFIMIGIGASAGVIRPELLSVIVAVSAVTAFTTPVLVRSSDTIADAIDRWLPRRLQTLLSLYESWFERSRTRPRPRARRSRVRKLILVLVVDGAAVTAIVIGASLYQTDVAQALMSMGLPEPMSRPAVVLSAVVLMGPFVLGLLRVARAIATDFAEAVLPPSETAGPDLAEAPRRMLSVALQLVAVVSVGVPVVVATQPFLPPFYGALVLGVLLVGLAIYFWRNAQNLHGHIRAGAEIVLELLARQSGSEDTLVSGVDQLLPGLGPISALTVEAGSPAADRTLAELNLRARTGATVVAVARGDEHIVTPSGEEILRVGDVLAVTGSSESIAAAHDLLHTAPTGRPE
jgi:CPA2 family monovalent cation:H+ antiporter-2